MKCLLLMTLLAAAAAGGTAQAAQLTLDLRNAQDKALDDVVVWLEGTVSPRKTAATAEIRQVHREFSPGVSVVGVGTRIEFPNLDPVKHHVYSFSPAKTFEIQLYSGRPAAPIVFDKPGLVVLGCNIHDWMQAYVRVVDSNWFGKSGSDGRVILNDMPAGRYTVHAWHPRQKTEINADALAQVVQLKARERRALRLAIDVTPAPQRKPRASDDTQY
jgi:plastocyanin